MSFPVYSNYKDSGIEWLGQVPAHWELKRLRFVSEIGTGHGDTVDAQEGGSYPFFVRSQTVERIERYTHDCKAVLTAGDGVGVGKVFHYIDGKFAAHQRVYIFSEFEGVNAEFFFLYLRENFFKVALEGGAKSTVDSLRRPLIANFMITVPPPAEQNDISAFLDEETSKIDALVEAQRRLVDLLKEKRQAVISRAVTKGLHPTAPMKDSGVEWLGDVPAHWAVTQLKRLCEAITDGAHISPETENGTYCFVSTRDIGDGRIDFENCLRTSQENYEYLQRTGCRPLAGDALFSKDGTIGRTAVVMDNREFVVASSLIIIRPDPDNLSAEFLDYLCQSVAVQDQVESFVKGAGLPRLSIQNLCRIVGVYPPIDEQKEIAVALAAFTSRVDKLIAEAEVAITLLRERRSALVSAAVTGKIDVRGLVPSKAEAA